MLPPLRHSASGLAAIGRVATPAADLGVWEVAARETGWLYGIEARATDGTAAFAGMLWWRRRLENWEIWPAMGPTRAGPLEDVSPMSQSGAQSPLGPLAELALLKLGLFYARASRSSRIEFYVSAFEDGTGENIHRRRLLKRSLRSFRPGEERQRPIAVDAQCEFNDWNQVIAFSARHPSIVWLEDPLPIKMWPIDPACPVPIATGELATSVGEVETILRASASAHIILHLELSRLGPIRLVACLGLAQRSTTSVIFHGHLPLETGLLLGQLGIGGLVELNLSHFSERAPWPFAKRWIKGLGTSKPGRDPARILTQMLKVGVPDGAVKRI